MSRMSPALRVPEDDSIVRNIVTAIEQEVDLEADATTSKAKSFSKKTSAKRGPLTRLENHLVDANEKELPATRVRKPAERLEVSFKRPEPKKRGRAKKVPKVAVVAKKVEKKKKVTKKKATPAKKKKAPAKKKASAKKTKASAKKTKASLAKKTKAQPKKKASTKKKVAPKKEKDAKKTPKEKKKRALSKNTLVTDTVLPVENKVQSKLPLIEAASPAEDHEREKENTPAVE